MVTLSMPHQTRSCRAPCGADHRSAQTVTASTSTSTERLGHTRATIAAAPQQRGRPAHAPDGRHTARHPANDLRWTGGITPSTPAQPGPLVQGATVERTAKFLGRAFTYGYVF